jgi:hypothetical protein
MKSLRHWVAHAAALWAAVFAVFHIVWAAGWYPLLNAEGARLAFAVSWKWWYNAVAAVMCVIAVPVALAPVSSWGHFAAYLASAPSGESTTFT